VRVLFVIPVFQLGFLQSGYQILDEPSGLIYRTAAISVKLTYLFISLLLTHSLCSSLLSSLFFIGTALMKKQTY